MLRFLMAALKGAPAALGWLFWFGFEVVTAPLRAMQPGPGRSAIPSAPPRLANPSPAVLPEISPKAVADRQAAATVTWLASRLRQGSGCPALSTDISPAVRNWAYGLDDDQARRAIALGFSGVAEHLSGRCHAAGLPVPGANIAEGDSGHMNRLRPAARVIRT